MLAKAWPLTAEHVREVHEGGDERMVCGGLVVELLQGVQHVRIIPRARLRTRAAADKRRALPGARTGPEEMLMQHTPDWAVLYF